MPELLKSPAIPTAILNFFANQPDFSALAGDISEEFQQRALVSGAAAARRWYWREAFRNAWALSAREMLRTPVRTLLMAAACLIAVSLLTGLYLAISYYPFQLAPGIGRFLSSWDPMELARNRRNRDLLLLLQFTSPLALGWIGGRLLAGREWALALMYTFLQACVGVVPAWYVFSLKVTIPQPLLEFGLLAQALRLGGFWLGALWVRRSAMTRRLGRRAC